MAFKNFSASDFNSIVADAQRAVGAVARVDIQGLSETLQNADTLMNYMVRGAAKGGKAAAKAVLLEAQKHVPFKTGRLFDTGRILNPAGDIESLGSDDVSPSFITQSKYGPKQVIQWTVAFGDGEVDYAQVVHENPSGHAYVQGTGPYSGEIKTSHFLSNAAEHINAQGTFPVTVADHVVAEMQAAQRAFVAAPATRGLSNGGAPRLVKRAK